MLCLSTCYPMLLFCSDIRDGKQQLMDITYDSRMLRKENITMLLDMKC
jgi:hypothetical protein